MATRHNQQLRNAFIGPAPQNDEEWDQPGQRQQGGQPDEEEE
jgi:hypothetical protein